MADFLTTTVPTVLNYTSKICSPLLRLFYSSTKLDAFLLIDITPTGNPVNYYFHSQEGTCDLMVTNLSPFDFTVDRIKVNVVLDSGGAFSCTHHMPQVVKGGSRASIFMRSGSPMTAEVLVHAKNCKRARADIEAYIVTKIRSFPIRRHIEDLGNIRVS